VTDTPVSSTTIPGTRWGSWRVRRSGRPPLLLVAIACLAAAVTFLPVIYLADRVAALGWSNVVDELFQRRTFELLGRSLALTGVVTALCVVIGVTAAWLVMRSDIPGRRIWPVALALPLAVPSYVAAYAWLSWRPSMSAFPGAVLVLTTISYPYVFLPVAAALRRLDPAQEEVARSLGHGRFRVALTLTIPQIRPAIAAGALLVALYVLSDFGAVATMRYEVFTFVIYGAYAGFNPSRAAILALPLVAMASVLVLLETWVRGSSAYARLGSGSARLPTPVQLGRARPVALGLVGGIVVIAIGFPIWRFTYWVRQALEVSVPTSDILHALGSSVWFAALAAGVTIVLAVPVGVLAARYRTRGIAVLERSTYLAHALPGIVVGIALVFVGVRFLRAYYQEVPLLILAYVVLFLPLAVGSVRAAVEQSSRRYEEVARSLGSTPLRVLGRITLPLAAPALAGGAALVFITVMKELPATLLLHPTGTETLATRLWTFTSTTDYAAAAPYAVALVLFTAIPTAFLVRFLVAPAVERGDVVS